MKIIILICSIVFAFYCQSYAEDNIPIVTIKTPIDKSMTSCELHLRLTPEPHLVMGNNNILLKDINSFVAKKGQIKIKWTLYMPDRIPIYTAILLFEQFLTAKSKNVAVYAEKPDSNALKREIWIELWPNDPVRIITKVRDAYPPLLEKYREYHPEKDLFLAKCSISGIKEILPLLLEISPDKHIRLQEAGGLEGLPADRYVELLKTIRELGILYISVCGVYLE